MDLMENAFMQNEYSTVVHIDAAPKTVWKALTDAAAYEKWNPEINGIAGRFEPGRKFTVRVKITGGQIRSVTMRVTTFDPPAHMVWTGGLPLGLFVGRRTFTVSSQGTGAEFRMHLSMTGPLARLILSTLGDRQPEIDSFSAALKAHIEAGAA